MRSQTHPTRFPAATPGTFLVVRLGGWRRFAPLKHPATDLGNRVRQA